MTNAMSPNCLTLPSIHIAAEELPIRWLSVMKTESVPTEMCRRVALGSRFFFGNHVACNPHFAVTELIQPAAENGFAPALHLIYSEKCPFDEVHLSDASVRNAADLGIPQACIALADRFAGQLRDADALYFYQKGIAADPVGCYEKMGSLCSNPQSVVYHPQNAVGYLRKAINNGSRSAEQIMKE